jgi:hypothetical protein
LRLLRCKGELNRDQSTARAFNSMCVEPILVAEKRTNRPRDLPVLIPFKAGREGSAVEQHGPSQPDKLCLGVKRLVVGMVKRWRNRRHGSHLSMSTG